MVRRLVNGGCAGGIRAMESKVREVRADLRINIMRRRNNGPVFITTRTTS